MDIRTEGLTHPLLEILDTPDNHFWIFLASQMMLKAMLEIGIFSLFQTWDGQTL